MQAIEVRYKGPTSHLGARLIVRAGKTRVVYNADDYTPAQAAADFVALRDWQSLPGNWVGGELPNGSTVFVHAHTPDLRPANNRAQIPNSTYEAYL